MPFAPGPPVRAHSDDYPGVGAVGDPLLLAVDHVAVAVAARRGRHAAGSLPTAGSDNAKAPVTCSPPVMRGR